MPEIPFNPQIPRLNEKLSTSQTDILENFQGVDAFINVNHVGFNDGDSGKHKFVTMTAFDTPFEISDQTGLLSSEIDFLDAQGAPVPILNYVNNNPDNQGGAFVTLSNYVIKRVNQTGYFVIGASIIVRWGPLFGLPRPAGNYRIDYPANVNIPLFRVGTAPLVFLSYYNFGPEELNSGVPIPVPPLLMAAFNSDNRGFSINKIATDSNALGTIVNTNYLSIGLI